MTQILIGVPLTLEEDIVYALPPRSCLCNVTLSGSSIEVSNDASTWTPITLTNGAFFTSASFVRSVDGDSIIEAKVYTILEETNIDAEPAGIDHQVQINDNGSFGAITNGAAGTVLTSNGVGSDPTFQAAGGGGGSPGGDDTQVQFNDSGSFGGTDFITIDSTLNLSFPGAGSNPITITGGDDEFGNSALVFDCEDGYIVTRFEQYCELQFIDAGDINCIGSFFMTSVDVLDPTNQYGKLELGPDEISLFTGVTNADTDSGPIRLFTYPVTGTGNSGNITLQIGTSEATRGNIKLIDLPTSDPGVPGAVYRTLGALMISI